MLEVHSEGIVLSAVPYRERGRIVTVLTSGRGVVSLVVRLSTRRAHLISLTTPLCRGAFIYKPGRTYLHSLIDGEVLNLYLNVRRSHLHLQVAGQMLNMVKQSQDAEHSSPSLYRLFVSFLKQLNLSSFHPHLIYSSFCMKWLKYEGLLSCSLYCNRCFHHLASALHLGESLCVHCSPQETSQFSKKEWEIIYLLYHLRSFSELIPISFSQELYKKLTRCLYNEEYFPFPSPPPMEKSGSKMIDMKSSRGEMRGK